MKIRKAIKLATAGAIVATPALAAAMGNPLTVHGQWSLDATGNIVDNGPTGMTCAASDNSETGFLQHQCVDGSGKTFIRTIVAEGASGDSFASSGNDFFGDESFVVIGGAGGLSGQQKLVHGHQATLVAEAKLNTGGEFMPMTSATTPNGLAAATDMIELDQSITATGEEFTTTFDFDHGMLMADTVAGADGKYALLNLGQNTNDTAAGFTSSFGMEELGWEDLNDAGATQLTVSTGTTEFEAGRALDVASDLNDAGITQSFDLNERSGVYVTASGTATTGDGQTATFAAGDEVEQLLVGQTVANAGEFGVNDFANNTQTGQTAAQDSFITSSPLLTVSPDPFGTF